MDLELIMAKSVNQVILLGRLVRDAEARSTNSGKSVATFSLAVDKLPEGADFFEVTVWDKLAENVTKYTGKGSKILVQGRLSQQTWEQDGQKRSKVVITATDVTFLDSKSEKDTVSDDAGDDPVNIDDIPF